MRLLVTGGRTGYLGRHVVDAAAAAGLHVVAVGSADADVRDPAAVAALLDRHRPDVVVHTAYVQSDGEVTATGAAHVARAAAHRGARVVLVSSDVVFGGSSEPYLEDAPTDPVSAYGEAKVEAERAVLAACQDAVVARTSLILGDGESKHERLFRALALGADGALFEDEQRTPVHVADLAAALVELAGSDVRGVLHCAGADAMSRLELGQLVARRDGLDPTVLRPGRRADLPDPGPVDVRLESSLAAEVLGTRLRGAREFVR